MSKTAQLHLLALALVGTALSVTNAKGETADIPAGNEDVHHLKPGDTITITVIDVEQRAREQAAQAAADSATAEAPAAALSTDASPVAAAVADDTAGGTRPRKTT